MKKPAEGLKMDELLQQLTDRLGIDTSTAKSVTAKTMKMLEENVGGDLFSKISSAVPGLTDLIAGDSDPAEESAGGGLLGKLGGLASSVLGDRVGNGLELGTILSKAGIGSDKFGDFVETIVDFIREKAGADVLDQIFEKVPMLKSLLR